MFTVIDGNSEPTGGGHQTWLWLNISNILAIVSNLSSSEK